MSDNVWQYIMWTRTPGGWTRDPDLTCILRGPDGWTVESVFAEIDANPLPDGPTRLDAPADDDRAARAEVDARWPVAPRALRLWSGRILTRDRETVRSLRQRVAEPLAVIAECEARIASIEAALASAGINTHTPAADATGRAGCTVGGE